MKLHLRWLVLAVLLALDVTVARGAAAAPAIEVAKAMREADCRAAVTVSYTTSLWLNIDYRCRATESVTFQAVGGPARRFISEVRDRDGNAIAERDSAWLAESKSGEARITYRSAIGDLAKATDSMAEAVARDRAVMALIGTWLLQPRLTGKPNPTIDIEVHPGTQGARLLTGLPRLGDVWRLQDSGMYFAGYSAIGDFGSYELSLPALDAIQPSEAVGPSVRVAILPGSLSVSNANIVEWIDRTAHAEANFWDGFAAPGLLITVVPRQGMARVGYGRVVPGGGATMALEIGSRAQQRDLYEDWVLVHELIHAAMPYVTGRASWLMEGTATWLEPIIRARAGWKSEADVWKEWISDMPRGLAGLAEGGSGSRFSVYWSGALVMLLTDIEARRASEGRLGVEDCLRGILHNGARARERWSLEHFLRRCDAFMGGSYLTPNAQRYVTQGEALDLAAVWRELGVSLQDGQVRFDDSAPLAWVRRTLVMGNPSRPARLVARPSMP